MANVFNLNNETFYTGDTVRVHLKVNEGDKTRIQIFEGMIIKIRGSLANKTFTVRKIAANSIGVERILPVLSPSIAKLEKKAEGKVRRAKLYYLRDRIGKRALKVKVKDVQKSANVDTSETKTAKASSKSATPKAASKASDGKSRGTASKKAATK